MTHPIAAAVQMHSGADVDANLARAAALVRQAAGRGAALIVLPEVFAWRGLRAEEGGVRACIFDAIAAMPFNSLNLQPFFRYRSP